jgi:hypothetical protein
MLAPVVLGLPASLGDPGHAYHPAGVAVLVVHTVAMFLVMGLVALVVYQTIGVALLRRAWVNLDLLWALALVLAGVATLWVG